ncbi:hypothetical protein TomTYG75_07160 [Sphingobium sp. TomTYG75]
MPWVAVNPAAQQWALTANERTYYASYYAVDDYVEDEEWTLAQEASNVWVPVS